MKYARFGFVFWKHKIESAWVSYLKKNCLFFNSTQIFCFLFQYFQPLFSTLTSDNTKASSMRRKF